MDLLRACRLSLAILTNSSLLGYAGILTLDITVRWVAFEPGPIGLVQEPVPPLCCPLYGMKKVVVPWGALKALLPHSVIAHGAPIHGCVPGMQDIQPHNELSGHLGDEHLSP
jgi:hypothetical protein